MLFLILLLPPYMALLYIVFDVYRLKKAKPIHCYAACFILAMIGIYWFPWGDSQSHFAYYYSDIVEKYYSNYLLSSTYWFYDLVTTVIANYTGYYTWGYFFWLLVPMLLFCFGVKQNKPDKKFDYRIFLYLLLFLGIREWLDLSRSTSAYLLFVSFVLLLKKNKILSIICLLMSLMLHDSIRSFLLVIPLGYIVSRFSNHKIYLLYVLAAVCSVVILNYALPILLSERNIAHYLGENWQDSKGVNSGFMYILGLINLLIFCVQFILIQANRDRIGRALYVLFLSSSFVVMCGFSMWVLRERFIILSNIIGASIILINWDIFVGIYKKTKWHILLYLNTLFVFRILLHLMLLYSARYVYDSASLNNKKEFEIVSHSFYIPTILLFDIDSYGFSDKQYLQLYERVNESLEL